MKKITRLFTVLVLALMIHSCKDAPGLGLFYRTSELNGILEMSYSYDFSENAVDSTYSFGDGYVFYPYKTSEMPLYYNSNFGMYQNFGNIPFDMVQVAIPQSWDTAAVNNPKNLEVGDVILTECEDGYAKFKVNSIYYTTEHGGYLTPKVEIKYIFWSESYNPTNGTVGK